MILFIYVQNYTSGLLINNEANMYGTMYDTSNLMNHSVNSISKPTYREVTQRSQKVTIR